MIKKKKMPVQKGKIKGNMPTMEVSLPKPRNTKEAKQRKAGVLLKKSKTAGY